MKKHSYTALLFFLISFFGVNASAQSKQDSTPVLKALQGIEKALQAKDSVSLKPLLHNDLVFGHSNGWTQSKTQVLEDMRTGYLVYEEIVPTAVSITMLKKRAFVKEKMQVKGKVNGTAFQLQLFMLAEFVKEGKQWQLVVRQSTKL
ncbi:MULTISPECIES: nuclear transport factor 2 family protein [unclassified Paraflavitalea]|uniref:nuclear transport factor 2 family protein n=1 Tax=unclassified Paraflavitalea TaxID=2798305 RepID=UPI003D3416DB